MKDKLTVAALLTPHGARARRCVAPFAEGGASSAASSLAGSRLLLGAHTTRLGAVPVARPLRPPVPRFVCANRYVAVSNWICTPRLPFGNTSPKLTMD